MVVGAQFTMGGGAKKGLGAKKKSIPKSKEKKYAVEGKLV
jgi:hypothetical protein